MIDPSFMAQRPIRMDSGPRSGPAELDLFTQQVVQDRIGRQLREMYSDLMEQPLPDRLASLLSQLERESEGEHE
jgi:hypothetical protein